MTGAQSLPSLPIVDGAEAHTKDLKTKLDTETVAEQKPLEKVPVSNIDIGQQEASKVGWIGQEWECLYELWQKESRWRDSAQNPTSTAYGIAQFLDSTWSMTDYQKTSDPRSQIKAGIQYIQRTRYKTPCSALAFWKNPTSPPYNQNWY